MSGIDIRHTHSLKPKEARKAVEQLTEKLAERFDMEYHWEGDRMHFTRSGVDGFITLGAKDLHISAKLGFLLSAFRGPIEHEIQRVLDERFT